MTIGTSDVVEYHNSALRMHDEIDAKFTPFLQLVDSDVAGGEANSESARNALQDGKSRAAPVVEELGNLAVPDDDLCRIFHVNLVKMAETYSAHDATFTEIATYIESHRSPTTEDRIALDQLMKPFLTERELNRIAVDQSQQLIAQRFDVGPHR